MLIHGKFTFLYQFINFCLNNVHLDTVHNTSKEKKKTHFTLFTIKKCIFGPRFYKNVFVVNMPEYFFLAPFTIYPV